MESEVVRFEKHRYGESRRGTLRASDPDQIQVGNIEYTVGPPRSWKNVEKPRTTHNLVIPPVLVRAPLSRALRFGPMITSRHFSSHVKDAKSRERREIRREAATALGRFSNLFQEDQIRRAVTFRILIKNRRGKQKTGTLSAELARRKSLRNTSCLHGTRPVYTISLCVSVLFSTAHLNSTVSMPITVTTFCSRRP